MSITTHAVYKMKRRQLDMDEVQRTALYAPRYRTYNDRWACINKSLVVIVSDDDHIITCFVGRPGKIRRLTAA